ncbi:MAG: DUF4337 family protein [Ginsengibacter sp.]
MEDIEIPTEHLNEEINEKAEERKEKWSLYVALSTALMAVLAAICGLIAGHHANEAVIEQIKSSDQWSFYQSKSIKSDITALTVKIVSQFSAKPTDSIDIKKIQRYEKEKEELKKSAEESQKSSEVHMNKHNILSRGVTLFQIAIAMAAIAILTKRKLLWSISILLALAGLIFLIQGTVF